MKVQPMVAMGELKSAMFAHESCDVSSRHIVYRRSARFGAPVEVVPISGRIALSGTSVVIRCPSRAFTASRGTIAL
jgi:hypothetical protein